jgi:hypothetical protein
MADWLTDLESVFQVGVLLPLLPVRVQIRPDPLLIGLPDPDYCESNILIINQDPNANKAMVIHIVGTT